MNRLSGYYIFFLVLSQQLKINIFKTAINGIDSNSIRLLLDLIFINTFHELYLRLSAEHREIKSENVWVIEIKKEKNPAL